MEVPINQKIILNFADLEAITSSANLVSVSTKMVAKMGLDPLPKLSLKSGILVSKAVKNWNQPKGILILTQVR